MGRGVWRWGLLAVLAALPLAAQSVTIEVNAVPADCVVGQSVAFEAVVTSPGTTTSGLAVDDPGFRGGTVLPAGQPTRTVSGGQTVSTYRWQLIPDQTGDLLVDPVRVTWVDPFSGQREVSRSARVSLRVRAAPADDDVLRGPKAPVPLPTSPVGWYVGAGLAVLGLLLLYRARRRPAPPPPPPPPPAATGPSPRDRALAALDALEAEGLPEAGAIDAYHIRLADVLREFLRGQFGLPAEALATSEIAARLEDQRVAAQDVATTRQVLYGCDLEKFAAYTPSLDEMHGLARAARSLIIGLSMGRD